MPIERNAATPEDDRRDEGDLVALEQVGGHAGAVTDVVAHVVGDGGGVAGVVLGDALLDLAHEVGADVGGLGEDAATHPHEQGDERAAEAEADEDRRGGVLEDHDDDRGAEQAEADREHAGHAAGAERHLERVLERSAAAAAAVRTLPRTARLMPMNPVSADRTAPATKASVRYRPDSPRPSADREVGLDDLDRGDEHEDRDRHHDDGDRLELALQVGHRAFLDGRRRSRSSSACPGRRRARRASSTRPTMSASSAVAAQKISQYHSVDVELELLVPALGREDEALHPVLAPCLGRDRPDPGSPRAVGPRKRPAARADGTRRSAARSGRGGHPMGRDLPTSNCGRPLARYSTWYGTEVTTVPLRNSRRPLRISALWLWSRCSHQWLHHELGDHDRDDVVVVARLELVDEAAASGV